MRKVLSVGLLVVGMIGFTSATSRADLTWGYTGDLLDFDASIETGWLVQMYHDVSQDSLLGSITQFDFSGTPTGGNSSDDVLLGSFTALVGDTKGGAPFIWGEDFTPGEWSFLQNEDVYSVLYSSSSIGSASQAVVIDASPFSLPGADPATYTQGTVDNDWVGVIPEPSTMALLGMGVIGLLGLRRRVVK